MIRILSLGAGVQSSTLALMIAKGEVPMVDAAIFADTGAEPVATYEYLQWLESKLPYPVIRVSQGDLLNDVMSRKDGFNPIPAYRDGSIGRRQCTFQYKLRPLHRKMRELAGLGKGERSDGVQVDCLIGISHDEVFRMKPSQDKWRVHSWPLVDLRMTRGHCLEWMEKMGYPKPPRSACVFCPYRADKEWRELAGVDFETALKVDESLREHGEYLHRTEKPLSEVDFTASTQVDFFVNECEGMCGV